MSAAPAPRSRQSRAERRRALGRPERQPASRQLLRRRALTALWAVATVVLLGFTAIGIEHMITWYLAVDQYGYLAFAHDLLHGHVFHYWPPLDALLPKLPPRVDMLSQTYVYDRGLLYCRYAPGFPLLLAGWLGLFGDDGAHYLNPTIFMLLLVVALAFQARIFRSRWRATAGVALIVLCPTRIHLWALTLVRELSTHLFALLGLFLLLPAGRRLSDRRIAVAGLALGFADSIRPDSVLYLVPALLLAGSRWQHERPGWRAVTRGIAVGGLAVMLGLAPFLAYNWAATGNPFLPTQGMEIQGFLPTTPGPPPPPPPPPLPRVGYPPAAWIGGTIDPVQGGGLSLKNLPRVLPENFALNIRPAYTDLLLGLAAWGAIVALVQRRMLFFAAVPYTVLAVLFFSCWSHSDPRYLSGIFVLVPMLIVEGMFGTLDLIRRLSRGGNVVAARGLASFYGAALLAGALFLPESTAKQQPLPTLVVLIPAIAGAAALAAGSWPNRRVVAVAAPVLTLALVTLAAWRGAEGLQARATFQRPQMLRARATFARAVEPGAVVITSEDVGRPGENIDYYSGVAKALYLTDLARWRLPVADAAELLARGGLKPYLLIPTILPGPEERSWTIRRTKMLEDVRKRFSVEVAADIPELRAIDYFVAAAFYPRGIHMELYRLSPLATAGAEAP